MMDDDVFQDVSSGASKTFPMQCSSLRKNGFAILKGHPCKIVNMTTSKTGKHGHAKVHLTGIDIFNGKKYEDICPSTHNIEVPNVYKKIFEVIALNDGFLELLHDNGTLREDLRLPDNHVGKEIVLRLKNDEKFFVVVLTAMDEEDIVAIKTDK